MDCWIDYVHSLITSSTMKLCVIDRFTTRCSTKEREEGKDFATFRLLTHLKYAFYANYL